MKRTLSTRALAAMIALALVAGGAAALARPGDEAAAPPVAVPPLDDVVSLLGPLTNLLSGVLDVDDLLGIDDLAVLRVPDGIRVALLSSGVDLATFGDAFAPNLTLHGGPDAVGVGTYATSVLLQLAPNARITSLNVYRGEQADPGAVTKALSWALEHASDLDAVVLALSPADVLDPVSALMGQSRWSGAADGSDPGAAWALEGMSEAWVWLQEDLAALADAGLPVVVPAGDLGPGPQTVLGIAGLPQVITVGAFDGTSVAAVSGSGPSLHGGAKPDLVAPAAVPGLVPEGSVLADLLATTGALVPDLPLELPAAAAGGLTASPSSTVPAALLVAAALARLRVEGIGDPVALRGALVAAAEPLDGVPVWRQGAGVVRTLPTAELARTRPLAGGPLDLGAEPPAGASWTAAFPIRNGALGADPSVVFPDLITTTATAGKAVVPAADATTPAQGLSLESVDGSLRAALPAGDNPWDAGAYCGLVEMLLRGAVLDVVEHVPACLVEGLSLGAFSFYIHDLPAEDETFTLTPALPPGLELLDGPLMLLPLNPLHHPLLVGVSGPDGMVRLTNVPPTFFTFRHFSDYGAPVVEQLPAGGGVTGPHERDLGNAATYLSYDALVLPNPCAERIEDNRATGTPCHTAWLNGQPGVTVTGYDKTTSRYKADTPTGSIGVLFDFTKKSAGTAVTSRYVDLLSHGDIPYGSAVTLDPLDEQLLGGLGIHLADAWSFHPVDGEDTLAVFRGLDTETEPWSLAAAGTYPFALTTPNYRGTLSLDFTYQLQDALMAVLVRAGETTHTTLIGPEGTVEIGPIDSEHPFERLTGLLTVGAATGSTGIRVPLALGGADHGTITIAMLPTQPLRPAAVRIGDLRLEATTWQRIDWPPAMLPRGAGEVPGHAFQLDSNYDARQMNHPSCRSVDGGAGAVPVCENWQVLVHSPIDDVETFELVDLASGHGFMHELGGLGGAFYNPHRGVHGERTTAAVGDSGGDAGGIEDAIDGLADLVRLGLGLSAGLVTNGRFFEQLVLPSAALAAHPGPVEVRLEDNHVGGHSSLLEHHDGPVPLAPYVGYASAQQHLDDAALDELLTSVLGTLPVPAVDELPLPVEPPLTVPPLAVPPLPGIPVVAKSQAPASLPPQVCILAGQLVRG